ncbi:MAG: hypothetical protein QW587_01310 [Candidatus Bathyarchaeia archaeon]
MRPPRPRGARGLGEGKHRGLNEEDARFRYLEGLVRLPGFIYAHLRHPPLQAGGWLHPEPRLGFRTVLEASELLDHR